jgi:pimeloyl-ACP methyl ester carboxylesterase
MVIEADLKLADGRTLHYDDTGGDHTAVFWHHGTPNVGSPPEPLFAAAADNGLRWVSYDRPAYGGSSPHSDQVVASAAADVAAMADALGLERFAVFGHSGGGPRALACGALLPGRVLGVVSVSAPAPHDADGLDWFAGWSKSGTAEQRAAAAGRGALEDYVSHAEFDMDDFTQADQEALGGRWAWIGRVAGQAIEAGPDAMIDDLLAAARPWGVDLPDLSGAGAHPARRPRPDGAEHARPLACGTRSRRRAAGAGRRRAHLRARPRPGSAGMAQPADRRLAGLVAFALASDSSASIAPLPP